MSVKCCFLPCRCGSLLRGSDTHLVSGTVSGGADGSAQPRHARPPRHNSSQRRDPSRATPVILRRHRHQQEAAAPALSHKASPSVSGGSQIAPS